MNGRYAMKPNPTIPQMAGAVEYTDSISAEWQDSPNEYDIKPSVGEFLVLALWGIWSTPSLPLLSGPLWPVAVALNRVLSLTTLIFHDDSVIHQNVKIKMFTI